MAAANKNMAAYMRNYRAAGRDTGNYRPQRSSAGRVSVARHAPGHNATGGRSVGEQTLRDEMTRHKRRDGALMWPNRAIGRDPSENIAEVEQTLQRIKFR